ncbi:hypothetical protein L1987_63605 [Smallanthus sonchifolius]|uniref:Uncharacterized protein n=1 Tax=Smallanthus sonchifolius TaxID=185202 RepID=A0ACB9CDR7_9ASTR|nr:hypothetical protein L1987_63605 [Smallanthus sonchifolius]
MSYPDDMKIDIPLRQCSLIKDASFWQQDIAVVTKWDFSYGFPQDLASTSTKSTFEEKFLSQQPQAPVSLVSVAIKIFCICES